MNSFHLKSKIIILLIINFASVSAIAQSTTVSKPNIIFIYADDLGYGDVSCYGATKINTPNIDKIASQGLLFTNGHCSSSTCTPSRYSLLTGEYPFRKKGTSILSGDAGLIIDPKQTSLPAMLQNSGYKTGVVGKWHLGLGPKGGPDWNGTIKPGPLEIGFNSSFLLPATPDRVPCVFVKDHHVVNLDLKDSLKVSYRKKVGNDPTGKENPELLRMMYSHSHNQTIVNGISRIGYMSGANKARWVDEDIADTLVKHAKQFIGTHKASPFFLYFATHDIHVPHTPHSRFLGKSKLGIRGDAILQLDWMVGQVLKTLDSLNLTENTMIVFSSDNGPVLDDGYKDDAQEKLNGHTPAGVLRGGKYSKLEGGTRVPFIIKWPKVIKPGISDALVSQIDLYASLAALTGLKKSNSSATDSENTLNVFLGKSATGRTSLVESSGNLSLIKGDWKYIEPSDGPANRKTETGNLTQPQLYNLKNDIREKQNLAEKNPVILKEMVDLLQSIKNKK